jgi:glycosyltransferase involved in cell wall biosynthesis
MVLNDSAAGPAKGVVILSLGNSSPGDGGLFEFCSQVGLRIAALAPHWQAEHGLRIGFHLREDLVGHFGDHVAYWPVSRTQRRWPPLHPACALWHSLHQLNRYTPPTPSGPRLTTVHDLNYLYGKNFFSRWRDTRRMKALLARSDALVAISHHTAGDVKQHLGWAGPLEVIHNGARNLTQAPQEPLPGWPEGRPFLLHLSRLSPAKNTAALLACAAQLPELPLLICSPPNDHALQLKAANRLPNVHFMLGVSEAQKAWAYGHCSGFLFPSLTEGFGLPPIEVMHFGKPVFLSTRTSLPEVGGEHAFYFADFDPAQMARTVRQGLAQAQATPGYSQTVAAHAAQFDWDRCAAAYAATYLRLLAQAPRQGATASAPW